MNTIISSLVRKTDYDAKISKIEKKKLKHKHDKYSTTQKFNNLITDNSTARLEHAHFLTKALTANFLKKVHLNAKLETLATKAEIKVEQDKVLKILAFDSSYFSDKSCFEDDGFQTYLVFQPIRRYVKKVGNNERILTWKLKGLSDECCKCFKPLLVKLNRSCLKQYKRTCRHKTHICIVYQINLGSLNKIFHFKLQISLFGAVKLTKNADFDTYKYFECGIRFNLGGFVS